MFQILGVNEFALTIFPYLALPSWTICSIMEGVKMLKLSLTAALFASIGMVGAAGAQTNVRLLPPVTAAAEIYPGAYLPPDRRYEAAAFLPMEPEAFPSELDEMGYCSGATENPRSN